MKARLEFWAVGFGSLCCIIPLILIGIGLGGTIFPALLSGYKVPFMAAASAAMGLAWLLYFRDRKRCAEEGCTVMGRRTRLWLLGSTTSVLAVFMLLSFTPVGVAAGALLFPQPELPALTSQGIGPPPAGPTGEKSAGLTRLPGAPAGSRAKGTSSSAEATTTALKKVSLRVEGMT